LSLIAGKAMLKRVRNLRVAVLLARVLLVCSIFAVGLAPSAKADEYQYTITFDPFDPLNLTGLSMSATFEATSLPGSTDLDVDPSSVHILNSPHAASFVDYVNVSDARGSSFVCP
jgi:hypothetical protein